MYACLAVTCHLHFWQNDRDFLRATVVTRGWNGYRNKSQHRKSTLEKKILPPFQQGFEPATFQSRVRCSNHWAIPAPNWAFSSKTISLPKTLCYQLVFSKTTSLPTGILIKQLLPAGVLLKNDFVTYQCSLQTQLYYLPVFSSKTTSLLTDVLLKNKFVTNWCSPQKQFCY